MDHDSNSSGHTKNQDLTLYPHPCFPRIKSSLNGIEVRVFDELADLETARQRWEVRSRESWPVVSVTVHSDGSATLKHRGIIFWTFCKKQMYVKNK